MIESQKAAFIKTCEKIKSAIQSHYKWRWDDEFKVARAVFKESSAKEILEVILNEFPHHWDFATLATSSGYFSNFINTTFGMIPGQKVFASDPESDFILFAVWWPWGYDNNISLRIGLYSHDDSVMTEDEIFTHIKEWMDLSLI